MAAFAMAESLSCSQTAIADTMPIRNTVLMVELAGRNYTAVLGSDVDRDGMYLEITNHDGALVGEVFFSDVDGAMTITMHQAEVPIEVIEWLIASAKTRLPPTNVLVG